MTAVCCSGRCLGCCACCGARRCRVCRAQSRAVLPVLLVLLGAGYCAAWGGAWAGWKLLGAALCGALLDALGRRPVLALSVLLQLAAALVHAFLVVQEDAGLGDESVSPGPEENVTAMLEDWFSTTPTSYADVFLTSTLEPDTTLGADLVANASALLEDFLADVNVNGTTVPAAEPDDVLGARLARSACAGAALGMALPAALFYLAELWPGAQRGEACYVPAIAVVLGRGLAYALEGLEQGAVLDLGLGARGATLLGLAPALLGLLLLLPAPPSPYWLGMRALKGLRGTRAGDMAVLAHRRVIVRMRGLRDERGAREEAEDVLDTVREQRSSFCAGNCRGPFMAMLLVGALPLSGIPLVERHLPAVLEPFGPDIVSGDGAWVVRVACGAGLLLALAVVAVLVDWCGRRPMAVSACLVLAAGHATLGYFHWFVGIPVPPRAPLAWYITLGAVGMSALAGASLSALAWLVLAEVLPMRAKAVIPALALLLDVLLQSALDALNHVLPLFVDVDVQGRLWAASWCWAHSLWCVLLALVVVVVLPETKGFSLTQLHEIFRGPNRQNLQTRL